MAAGLRASFGSGVLAAAAVADWRGFAKEGIKGGGGQATLFFQARAGCSVCIGEFSGSALCKYMGLRLVLCLISDAE